MSATTLTRGTLDLNESPGNSTSEAPILASDFGSNVEPPTLVIGDLHGHLDRFEALLKQEGLLDRCVWCDGSGDKIVYQIDSGLAREYDCSACHGIGWARTSKPGRVIVVGDIAHNGITGSPTADMMTWQYADKWADLLLWGNHDRAVLDAQHVYKGYLAPGPEVRHIMARIYLEGRLRLAAEAHGWLITHAGLHKRFKFQKCDPELKEDIPAFVKWINENDFPYGEGEGDPEAFAITHAISGRRGGSSPYGGILWRDFNESLYKFPQVFGHSADKDRRVRISPGTNHRTHKSWCIDIGGADETPGAKCLAGIWLPEQRVVRIDFNEKPLYRINK